MMPRANATAIRNHAETTTHIDNLVCVPDIGIILDDATFSQQRNFDGMDTRLCPEHALNRLRDWSQYVVHT